MALLHQVVFQVGHQLRHWEVQVHVKKCWKWLAKWLCLPGWEGQAFTFTQLRQRAMDGYICWCNEKGLVPHPVPFDLFNPFGLLPEQTAEEKARGLNVEVNNGRLAMIGLFGFLAESKVRAGVRIPRRAYRALLDATSTRVVERISL